VASEVVSVWLKAAVGEIRDAAIRMSSRVVVFFIKDLLWYGVLGLDYGLPVAICVSVFWGFEALWIWIPAPENHFF